MFSCALAFFAGHRYFSLYFQPLSAFRGKRKKEFGRKHSQRKPLTTTRGQLSGEDCQIDRFACLQSLEENLRTINWKTEFP